MSHPVDLTLIQDGSEDQLLADFEDEEWKVLQAYLTYVSELAEAKLLKTGLPTSLSMKWDADSGMMSVQAELPPWEDVTFVLHKLRPLILEKESTNFAKVRSLLGKRLQNDVIRAFLKQLHEVYVSKKFQSMFKLTVNDEMLLNSDEALNIWLNAHEYHRFQEKQEKLERMTHMITFDGARAIFLVTLAEKIKAIFGLAEVVASVLGKEKSTNLQIYPKYLDKQQTSKN